MYLVHQNQRTPQLSSAQLSSAQRRVSPVMSVASPYIRHLKNQNGQSLIQLLVSIGIMSIMISAFASMQVSQQRQISQLSQKLATLDIQRSLTATLADPTNVCTYMANNPVLPAFDPMAVGTASPPVFNFTQIPSKGVAGAPPAVSTTGPASPLSNSLFVSSIQLTDVKCIPSLCTPNTNQFSANITVAFDSSKLVIGLAPLKFPTTVTTTGAANSQTITGCQGGVGSSSGYYYPTQVQQTAVVATTSVKAACTALLAGSHPCLVNEITAALMAGISLPTTGGLAAGVVSNVWYSCNGWTSNSSSYHAATASYDSTTGYITTQTTWCSALAHAWCCK